MTRQRPGKKPEKLADDVFLFCIVIYRRAFAGDDASRAQSETLEAFTAEQAGRRAQMNGAGQLRARMPTFR